MRQQFVKALDQLAQKDDRLMMITADLGYQSFEELRNHLGQRFINAGITEQHMVSLAAGLAWGGMQPWVYSIAPFISLKSVEQLRNDVCSRNLPVKLVGNGGGYGYGNMGPTHHVLEDIAVMQALPEVKSFIPSFTQDVEAVVARMYHRDRPSYLRLGLGASGVLDEPPAYAAARRIIKGDRLVLLVLGPLVYNAIKAVNKLPDMSAVELWSISELPFQPPQQLLESMGKVTTMMLVEEHTASGGLATWIYRCLVEHRLQPYHIQHVFANGYQFGYGSQAFHWRENGLDADGIHFHLSRLLELS